MPQVAKFNQSGKELEKVELNDSVFNDKINKHVVHQVVNAQLAARRGGNASTKTRGKVRGGGRKPWRQKGTGRARHGSIRSPLWVGGGITFGPSPRSYDKKLTKKMRRLALRSVLTDKVQRDELILVDKIELDQPKTKAVVNILADLNLEDKKVVLVMPEKDKNLYLSARNIPNVKTLLAGSINAYDLLDNEMVIFIEEAVKMVEEVLGE
ncbi:50S ribosomal protein L4 [Halanaerobium saccharolyticum]|jgi:large subunit ribosomal protein L4|uniref:Large ribosomal subunit protein uL4 n=1 Tax=Halanaerobium saccharolyticum TaxID=43595 RepID=A0A2T5RM85_9FIRM|nr:50S ribosomal protein L4 [Halanaerobium saccharolyticum]PTW00479.1 LSU ribosomal protein L4P [Halanaerobium saccharolyticum]PUU94386.1 MAG: large subunit ribosomal protein L4 [Halanaerobium sp.]TDQ06003.1 LSU ribosomal protein L4P [Halanaerobium saccharolyticum]